MLYIKDFLDKIKWDKRMNPDEYTLVYIDRFTGKEVEFEYSDIIGVAGTFLQVKTIVNQREKIVDIPMHRIVKIKKSGFVVWDRTGSAEE
jgi:uncharacterized protein (UPF0248 family)